jgi:site-specific DNA recombinase
MKVALYARVSSQEQVEGFSLDAQLKAMRELALHKEWDIAGEYTDAGFSARSDVRPEFKRLIADARAKRFDVILVHKFDRFSRRREDAVAYKALLRRIGIPVYSVTEPVDPESPSSVILEGVLEVVAEWYSVNLSHETSKGKRERAFQGLYNGDLPFAYAKGENGIPVIVPQEAQAIRKAFEAYASGRFSFRHVADLMNSLGFKTRNKRKAEIYGAAGPRPFTSDSMRDIIGNPFYAGFVGYKGERIKGRHEAIVSLEVFEKCQEVRRSHAKGPRTYSPGTKTYLLKGLVRCAFCGEKMWVNGSPGRRGYYRDVSSRRGIPCPRAGKWVRMEVLDRQISDIIGSTELPHTWELQIIDILNSLDERVTAAKERDRIEEKLRRLKRLYRDLELEESEYEMERNRLEVALASIIVPQEHVTMKAGQELAGMLEIWDQATDDEKSQMLRLMLETVYCDTEANAIVALKPKTPFLPLFSLCRGLTEKEGLFLAPAFAGIGDPEGDRTRMCNTPALFPY